MRWPPGSVAIDDLRVEDDRVTVRWTAGSRAPDDGSGAAPAQISASLTGLTSSHVVDGQILESWTTWDAALVLQQLGVVEAGYEETS
jgi:SnoaL-like polyketide cyclase